MTNRIYQKLLLSLVLIITTNLVFSQWLNDHEYKEGLRLAINSDFTESKIAFKKALSLDPKNSQIEIALDVCNQVLDGKISEPAAISFFEGNEKFRKCKYDKAIELYKDALNEKPLFIEAQYNLTMTKYIESVLVGNCTFDFSEFQKIISNNPDFIYAYIYNAESLFINGKYRKAIEAYKELLQIQPDNPSSLNNLTICYLAIGEVDQATEMVNNYSSLIQNNIKHALSDSIRPEFFKLNSRKRKFWNDMAAGALSTTLDAAESYKSGTYQTTHTDQYERSKTPYKEITREDLINEKVKEIVSVVYEQKMNTVKKYSDYRELVRWQKVKYYIAWSPFNKTTLTDLDRPKDGGLEDAGMAGGWSLGIAIPVSKHFTLRNDFKYNSRFPRIDDSTNYTSEGGPICELQYFEVIPKLTYSIPSSPYSNFYFSTGFEYRYLLSAKIQPVDNISGPEEAEATDIMNNSDVSSYALQLGIGYQWGIPKREMYGFIEFSYSYGFPTKINGTKTSITTINFISLGLGFY